MKCHIGGVCFDNVTMDEAVSAIATMAKCGSGPQLVCTANLDHLASLRNDAEFLAAYQAADLILADGMPIVWLSKAGPTPLKERVAGSDLLYALSRRSAEIGLRLFFLGGKPQAAKKTAEILEKLNPDLQIVGTYCPDKDVLNTPEEDAFIRTMIEESKPDILFVGFGAPKQEKWIVAHREILNVPVSIGVGASFDMAAGMVKRAPLWMQRWGFEWAFRLIQEPRRLVHRYLGKDLPYLVCLVREAMQQRKHFKSRTAPSNTKPIL